MGCGIAIIKYLVFIFNLVFAIIGLALLSVGVIFQSDVKHLDSHDAAGYTALFFIIVGSVIFIISFFGCCGAIKENSCMLTTYASLLLTLLISQVAIGVLYYVYLNDKIDVKQDNLNDVQRLFDNYNRTTDGTAYVDDMQQKLKCCGVDGPSDWKHKIPSSCCIDNVSPCRINDPALYPMGCAEKRYTKYNMLVNSVLYTVIAICTVEFLGMFFAFCLRNSMHNQYRRGVYA
ncbi:PREDICTED: 23 kDa integral membrane protein-like [Nicrophorus vespilloides]|uniref:Tetraspanin n=1 Tax=Nicrophorus vespilloides TaxID=110193 RepID=A0ABM1MX70_NICVS|nr:PREDICTED: 23 kDa integral membrane protein-like [Nicrophorus vespilloides]XP_017779172.1 PREDICTED: 23 kDa integral membrane protein-like [Nicrophorus vespilloides]